MKIKLVTFAPHPNYGTCLQSYALNRVLTSMGHDVEFIYNGRENPPLTVKKVIKQSLKLIFPSRLITYLKGIKFVSARSDAKNVEKAPVILKLPNNYFLYFFSRLPFYVFLYKIVKCRTLQKKKIYSFAFEEGNYRMKRLYIKNQYDEVVNDADLFVTGSDQIWNPYCGGFNPMMFLEFAGNKRRIAYSSSVSRPFFPKEVVARAKEDLSKFSHIAVREQSTVGMLKGLLGRDDIQLVVDPTYLLTRAEWTEFANKATIEITIPEKYVFCYFIGKRYEDYRSMVERVKVCTGIKEVVTMNCTTNSYNSGGGIFYKDGGPYEFVYLLSHASIVCLDSFHGTLFSLFFEKDFVHILKTKDDSIVSSQNSRIYDMFERYGILNKIYDENSMDWMNPVDYESVHVKIEKEKQESLKYLKNAIGHI